MELAVVQEVGSSTFVEVVDRLRPVRVAGRILLAVAVWRVGRALGMFPSTVVSELRNTT